MVKRTIGMTVMALMAVAPFMFMAQQARATVCDVRVCYVGPRHGKLGLVLHLSPEEGDRVVRKRLATYNYATSFKTFRGYDVCVPIRGKKRI